MITLYCCICAGKCSVAGQMQPFVDVCRAPYSIQDEDTANYDVGWTDLPQSTTNSTHVCLKAKHFPLDITQFIPVLIVVLLGVSDLSTWHVDIFAEQTEAANSQWKYGNKVAQNVIISPKFQSFYRKLTSLRTMMMADMFSWFGTSVVAVVWAH